MIAWLAGKLGLSQIVTELIIGAVLAGGAWYGLRLWGNAQWYKGEIKGRENVTKSLSADFEKREAILRAQIASDGKTITDSYKELETERSASAQARSMLQSSLDAKLKQIRVAEDSSHDFVSAVPASQLDGAIRAESAKLASAVH